MELKDEDIKKNLFKIAEKAANQDDIYFDGRASTELSQLLHNVVDLINRQQAEIERLQGAVQEWVDGKCLSQKHLLMIGNLQNEIEQAKSEAIKEFAERLESKYTKVVGCNAGYVYRTIKEVEKEMEGGENA